MSDTFEVSDISATCLRVTIINTYSWWNKGDAAIVLGTVEALRRIDPHARVTIVSMTPAVDREPFARFGVDVIGGPFRFIHEPGFSFRRRVATFAAHGAAMMAGAALARLGLRTFRWLPAPAREMVENVAQSNVVISAGGGFWSDSTKRSLYVHLLAVLCALLMGRPVVCLGQSIGPFKRSWRTRLIGRILNQCAAVVVREEESIPTAHAIGIDPRRIVRGIDMAFALTPAARTAPAGMPNPATGVAQDADLAVRWEPEANTPEWRLQPTQSPAPAGMPNPATGVAQDADLAVRSELRANTSEWRLQPTKRLCLGVTARQWLFPKSANPRQAQVQYERTLAEVIDRLIERYDCDVVFLPQVIGPDLDDDRIVQRRIAGALRHADRATVLTDDLSPDDLVRFIGGLDAVVATRFHSAIFSMLARVPVVAIAYEHKTTGITQLMGLRQWVLPIEDITTESLSRLCFDLIDQRDAVRQHLVKVVAEMNQRAHACAVEGITAALGAAWRAPVA